MPLHDWTKVDAGIFHDFHQRWAIQIADALNAELPEDHYAMIEQNITKEDNGRFGPDVITLHERDVSDSRSSSVLTLPKPPKVSGRIVTDAEFYRRKKNIVTVRHVSDDRIVACVEIVSPGNKAGRRAFSDFVIKSCELMMRGVHLLIVDVFPPSPRDPQGVHNAIWEELQGEPAEPLRSNQDRVVVGYECERDDIAAYPESVSVGSTLPEVPVFLQPGGCVMVNLEPAYDTAYRSLPVRWRRVIEA